MKNKKLQKKIDKTRAKIASANAKLEKLVAKQSRRDAKNAIELDRNIEIPLPS
jgi:hypothetical protein